MLKKIVVNYYTTIRPDKDTIVVNNTPPNPNRGFAAAVNLGIKQALKAGADTVLLLNPDVKITSSQIKTLAATPGDIVSPVLTFKRAGANIKDFGGQVNFFLGRTTHLENRQGHIDYVSGACMLIKKTVIEKIGLFDPQFFMYFEDVDYCLRATEAGFSVIVNSKIIVSHKIEEHRFNQNTQKIRYILKSNWRFINKWVPLIFRPAAYLYWLWLFLRLRKN